MTRHPAIDLAADFDVSDATLSAAAVTVKAAGLRERAARLERGFRTLVGELLFQIMVDS
jgi:putative heme degradation protein